jgi:hypothetical protein
VLGLDVGEDSDYAKLVDYPSEANSRHWSVGVDLLSNKPDEVGYDLTTLQEYFNAIVATRLATQASMDQVNEATSVETLGITWVTDLLAQFEAANEVYKYHSGILLTEKIATLQGLVDRYEALSSENQKAALQAVLNGKPYARSQATTDALDAALTEIEEEINARLEITSVSVVDNKAYASTAAGEGNTVRVLGYSVGINLGANSSGKKVSDTTSIVVELYKGETLLGQQTFNEAGYTKHGEASLISGTIDAGGQYVATSWDNSWSAGISEIPDKAVATVQYSDGTAIAEMALSFTDEQTKIFFAAEAVHALFEDVFADELVLADGVTQDAITAASTLVEAVTVKTDQNKAVLQGLITEAQTLLGGDQAAINERLGITGVSIVDNKAYASTAAGEGNTVRVLGYGVGINLDAKGAGKKSKRYYKHSSRTL